MKTRMAVRVEGIVQGVAFRHHTCREAVRLGVYGWVRNLADGSVEGLFEGNATEVGELVAWCRKGPPAATVERVQAVSGDYSGEFHEFSIRQ